ncbi:lipoprotein [Leminorella grimontii]|uniref:Lipoprotein n=2 Tax=Leminorella grimontii TaxID=82981 RepID=A0AAV5N600_9GAMM|nr:lipoprotein [Leminorella grimontii]
MDMKMKIAHYAGILLAVGALSGCMNSPKPIYSWDNYQATVYEYYKMDIGVEEQIAALKEDIEKAKAKGLPVPPGLHAHLGMLYVNSGRPELARTEFSEEKAQFPESAPFMDFLLKKMQGGAK